MRHAIPALLASLLASLHAGADVPPPPGYVETCSVDRQRQSGEECVACSTYFGEPDACMREHAKRGFSFRCRTRGASTWTEVWCKASSGVGVSSLGDPPDAGGEPGLVDASPAPADVEPSPPPSTTTAPEPAKTASTRPEPRPSPTGEPPKAPPAAAPDRTGGCGACEVGSPARPGVFPSGLITLLAVLSLRRRRGLWR